MAGDVLINSDRDVSTIDREAAIDSCRDSCGCGPSCPSRRARRIQFHPDFPECDRWVCVDSTDTVTGARLDEVDAGTTVRLGCRCYFVSDDYAGDVDSPVVAFTTDVSRTCEDCWVRGEPCSSQGRVVFGDGVVHERPPEMYFNASMFCTCSVFQVFAGTVPSGTPPDVVTAACYRLEPITPGVPLAEVPPGAYRVWNSLLDPSGAQIGQSQRIESGQCCDCVPGCTHRSQGFTALNGCDESVEIQCCCNGTFRATETFTGECRVWVTGDNNGQCVRVLFDSRTWTVETLARVFVEDGIVTRLERGIIRVIGVGLSGRGDGSYDPINETVEYGFDGLGVGNAYAACPPEGRRPVVPCSGGTPTVDGFGCTVSCGSVVSCDFTSTEHSYQCRFAADAGGCAGQVSAEGSAAHMISVERVGDCTGGCANGVVRRGRGTTGIEVLDILAGGI